MMGEIYFTVSFSFVEVFIHLLITTFTPHLFSWFKVTTTDMIGRGLNTMQSQIELLFSKLIEVSRLRKV